MEVALRQEIHRLAQSLVQHGRVDMSCHAVHGAVQKSDWVENQEKVDYLLGEGAQQSADAESARRVAFARLESRVLDLVCSCRFRKSAEMAVTR